MFGFFLGVIVGAIGYNYFRDSARREMPVGQSSTTTRGSSTSSTQTASGLAGSRTSSASQARTTQGQGAGGGSDILSRIQMGMPARSREGTSLGRVTEVHPEGAAGTRADATGYVRVEHQQADRREVLDLSITEIIDVQDGHLIVERDRDAVVRHDRQRSPGMPGR